MTERIYEDLMKLALEANKPGIRKKAWTLANAFREEMDAGSWPRTFQEVGIDQFLVHPHFTLDTVTKEVKAIATGQLVPMEPAGIHLLGLYMSRMGEYVTPNDFESLYSSNSPTDLGSTMRVHTFRIRKALMAHGICDPEHPNGFIETARPSKLDPRLKYRLVAPQKP